VEGKWKISGFVGYLLHPMGSSRESLPAGKAVPVGASQHKTAGPYSPVLTVSPGQLVVISGQAAIDNEGNVIGDTIEEQTRVTLDNCRTQLQTAGVDLKDVFKVNVYLTDLDNWPRFNEIYQTYFPEPLPVRTAVQTPLLMTLLVEIEMWAVKK
jgi:2-iminobutanoate/2-iminopropanoate deaminase